MMKFIDVPSGAIWSIGNTYINLNNVMYVSYKENNCKNLFKIITYFVCHMIDGSELEIGGIECSTKPIDGTNHSYKEYEKQFKKLSKKIEKMLNIKK